MGVIVFGFDQAFVKKLQKLRYLEPVQKNCVQCAFANDKKKFGETWSANRNEFPFADFILRSCTLASVSFRQTGQKCSTFQRVYNTGKVSYCIRPYASFLQLQQMGAEKNALACVAMLIYPTKVVDFAHHKSVTLFDICQSLPVLVMCLCSFTVIRWGVKRWEVLLISQHLTLDWAEEIGKGDARWSWAKQKVFETLYRVYS